MAQKIDVFVSTDSFESTHRRLPKGFGYWMFDIRLFGESYKQLEVPNSKYGDAKKKAIAWARERARSYGWGSVTVTVMP